MHDKLLIWGALIFWVALIFYYNFMV